jgi:[histone H3]-lysine36 N-dimethyltransferase SETMAR
MEFSEAEWRSHIKFCVVLNKPSAEIVQNLQQAMGPSAPSDRTIFRWIAHFKAGNQATENEARIGRPRSSRSEENINAIRILIRQDPQLSIEMIAAHTGLGYGSVQRILTDELCMRRILAKWVPHELSQSQMEERKETSLFLMKRLKSLGSDGRKSIVTGDETYLYLNFPETRRSASAWVAEGDPHPQIPKPKISGEKVCYGFFFGPEGLVAQIPAPPGTTVTGKFYADSVLPKVLRSFSAVRPGDTMLLHHDNAPAHRSGVVMEYIDQAGIKLLPHPPYSPDLAPCDFWLNCLLKESLAGNSYSSRSALGSGINQWFRGVPKERFEKVFEDWSMRLKICVESNGMYVV